MRRSFSAFLWATLAALGGCASTGTGPVPEINASASQLAPIAAEYQTTFAIKDDHGRTTTAVTWRIWRDGERIVTENLTAHTGELWQRDGNTLFHQKLFHDDRKSVEYQMDDLLMNGVKSSSLARQALLVDPELLTQLKLAKSGWHDGYPFRRYTGVVDGQQWNVTLRTDLNIATHVERRSTNLVETTEMTHAYPLGAAPWQATVTEAYEVIEYADFGDREEDPFVAKVLSQLGRPHSH